MDLSTAGTTAGLSAGSVSIILIIYHIIRCICNKKLISDCNGKNYEVGFQVKDMSNSPQNKPEIVIDSGKK